MSIGRYRAGIAGCGLALLCSLGLAAQDTAKPALPADPAQLVRETIDNEMKPSAGIHKSFRLTSHKPEQTTVKDVIETKDGAIARIVSINGKPLDAGQKAKEDQRLQRLIDDPKALAEKQKSQKEDDRRTRIMLKAMPDAFLYTYAGTEQTPEGEVVNLTFKPNPNFDPPSKETLVYRGMEGTMKISLPGKRLIDIKAKLFRDVSFGWGILGHLDKGGEFEVEQSQVLDHDWEITHMKLNFTGKVLVFKSLRIVQDESSSDFRVVPEMTAQQAIEKLNREANQQEQARKQQ